MEGGAGKAWVVRKHTSREAQSAASSACQYPSTHLPCKGPVWALLACSRAQHTSLLPDALPCFFHLPFHNQRSPHHIAADKDRRYVLHAVNRVAEIFLAKSDGSLIAGGVGASTRISLQKMMSVTTVTTVSSLIASEPVSLELWA